ncbi:unnamed protein product [Symbiodinium sp. CCMP2592]|nr:unnamed protein product [Symbiodinium sp. CCMP2592]
MQHHLLRTRHAAPFPLALLVVWTAATASFSLPPERLAALLGNPPLTESQIDLVDMLLKSKDEIIQSKDEAIKRADEAIKSKDDLLQVKEMELLRAKGLLSSRGIFEWTLRLAAKECRPKDKFNATATIKALRSGKNRGRWEAILSKGIKKCFSGERVKPTLQSIYGTLSDEIHGFPWTVNAVQLSDQLSSQERCFLLELCKALNLNLA